MGGGEDFKKDSAAKHMRSARSFNYITDQSPPPGAKRNPALRVCRCKPHHKHRSYSATTFMNPQP